MWPCGERSPAQALVVSRSLSVMGAVWSALLVGGGLAGALILWLLRGNSGAPGKDGVAEPPQKGAPPGEAAAPGGGPGGGGSGSLNPEPSDRELVSKAGILPPLEPVVLKFGKTKGTWSRTGGFWWTSFPDPRLSSLQPSSRFGAVLSWRRHEGPTEAAPSSSAWPCLAQCMRLAWRYLTTLQFQSCKRHFLSPSPRHTTPLLRSGAYKHHLI